MSLSQQAIRVDPNNPLPSPRRGSQSAQKSPFLDETTNPENGLGRTTSRKRRVSGQGNTRNTGRTPRSDDLPPAPDAPRAPPVSYRNPYDNDPAPPENKVSSKSFAARARTIPDKVDPRLANSLITGNVPAVNNKRHARRGSVHNAPKGQSPQAQEMSPSGLESNLDSAQPDSMLDGATSRNIQNLVQAPVQQKAKPFEAPLFPNADPSSAPSSSRRVSTEVAGSPSKWATDRSPLQKLEVKLIDKSKEEKRARVQEAEQLLRELKAAKSDRKASLAPNLPKERTMSKRERTRNGEGGSTKNAARDRLDGEDPMNSSSVRQGMRNVERELSRQDYDGGLEQRRNVSEPVASGQMNGNSSLTTHRAASQGHSWQGKRRSVGVADSNSFDRRDISLQKNETDNQTVNISGRTNFTDENHDQDSLPHRDYQVVDTSSPEHRRSLPQQSRPSRSQEFNDTPSRQVPSQQMHLYAIKAERTSGHTTAAADKDQKDPIPGRTARTYESGPKYETVPQTASGIDARQKIGFGSRADEAVEHNPGRQHHFSNLLHRDHHEERRSVVSQNSGLKHSDEWRQGGVAHLTLADRLADPEGSEDKHALWEGKSSGQRQNVGARNGEASSFGTERGFEDSNATISFNPRLYLKCGPLLRYAGLRREEASLSRNQGEPSVAENETWRGSVMIVTVDGESSYDPAPALRLFYQPIKILPPPPIQVYNESGGDLPSEYVDPIAGLPKMTRTGKIVYVKPVEDLEESVDVSRLENDDGLYEETRTANVPTAYGKADELLGRSPLPSLRKSQSRICEERPSGRYREVRGVRLHAERGVTFWRFNLEVELGEAQARIGYRINGAASIGFWVPGRGKTMNTMFHSCNGFSLSVNSNNFSGPDPLWRDVLNAHQTNPFHVMIGGGDQIYNDAVMRQTTHFQEWLGIKNPHHKHGVPFSWEMQDELETFYLDRYAMWFSQGLFGMANSQIPMINMWDDHDIIDGFGSYPHHFMRTPVFCGLGNVAFKYYMLFQHQSVVEETSVDEPSWLLGASRGPYINELSRSVFMSLGKHTAFLGLDCRTERMREQILSQASYDLVFERCRKELIKGVTKHLIVLLGVPIAYPRLVWLENILTSRVMDPIKALGRMGILGGFLNQFDGGVEILDDLDDHWTAKNHKDERNWFVQSLQDLSAEKSVRITILGGDVHLAAIGQFYSNPKLNIPKDRDHRYMPNVISSAIVNTPPPEMMGDILNKRNKVHHLDHETDEDMIPMFTHDVDGKTRNNKRLLPRRNWCSIREYQPGSTPPPTPPLSPAESEVSVPQKAPSRLQRTLSLTRGDSKPVNLLRRRSQRGPSSPEYPPSNEYYPSAISPSAQALADGYFSSQPEAAMSGANGAARNISAPLPTRPINSFHRRPTNLSEKAVAKGGLTAGEITLENGLDIVINCEVSQKDPAGYTVPYRLLVPALWYTGDVEVQHEANYKESWLKRLGSRKASKGEAARQGDGNRGNGSETVSESESEKENTYGTGRLGTQSKTSRTYEIKDPTPQARHSVTKNVAPRHMNQGGQREDDFSRPISGGGRLMNGTEPSVNNGILSPAGGRRSISDKRQPIGTGGTQMSQEPTLENHEAERQRTGSQLPASQQLLSPCSSIDQHERPLSGRNLSGKFFGWGVRTDPRSPNEHDEAPQKRLGGKLFSRARVDSDPDYEDGVRSQRSSSSERGAPPSSAKKLGGKFFGWGESTNPRSPVDQHNTFGNNLAERNNVHRGLDPKNLNRPESQRSSFSEQEERRPSTGRRLSGKFFGWGEPTAPRMPTDQRDVHPHSAREPTAGGAPNVRHDSRSDSPHSSDFSDAPPSPSAKRAGGKFFGWGEPVSSKYVSDRVDPPSSGKSPLNRFFGSVRATGAGQPQNSSDEMNYDKDADESPARSKTGKFDKNGGSKFFGTQGGGSVSGKGYGGIDAYKEKDKGWRKFI